MVTCFVWSFVFWGHLPYADTCLMRPPALFGHCLIRLYVNALSSWLPIEVTYHVFVRVCVCAVSARKSDHSRRWARAYSSGWWGVDAAPWVYTHRSQEPRHDADQGQGTFPLFAFHIFCIILIRGVDKFFKTLAKLASSAIFSHSPNNWTKI
jgi:hypothetical protein